jgi:hypothetical protein
VRIPGVSSSPSARLRALRLRTPPLATRQHHRTLLTTPAPVRQAFVPSAPEGVSAMSKFSDFKPIQSAKTPFSMMQSHPDAEAYPDAHRNQSRGVVPGYAGHVPKARDTFGSSAVGGLAPEPHVGAHKKLGPMMGHAEPVPWEKNYDWETQVYNQFSEKKTGGAPAAHRSGTSARAARSRRCRNRQSHRRASPRLALSLSRWLALAVMPGYAGFRPGARDVDGVAACGKIPHDGAYGQGDASPQKAGWDQGRMKPDTDFRQVVHGIVPGYAGHVPNAIDKHGVTPFGKLVKAGDRRGNNADNLYIDDGADSGDGGTHFGAQRGHTDSLLDKQNDVRTARCSTPRPACPRCTAPRPTPWPRCVIGPSTSHAFPSEPLM